MIGHPALRRMSRCWVLTGSAGIIVVCGGERAETYGLFRQPSIATALDLFAEGIANITRLMGPVCGELQMFDPEASTALTATHPISRVAARNHLAALRRGFMFNCSSRCAMVVIANASTSSIREVSSAAIIVLFEDTGARGSVWKPGREAAAPGRRSRAHGPAAAADIHAAGHG